MPRIGFSDAPRYLISDQDFLHAVLDDVGTVAGKFGDGIKFTTVVLSDTKLIQADPNIPINPNLGTSFGKKVNCVYWSQGALPGGGMDFPKNGKFKNAVEILAAAKGFSPERIEAIKQGKEDLDVLKGALCRILITNKVQKGQTTPYSNIDDTQIKPPTEATATFYQKYLDSKGVAAQNQTVQQPVQQQVVNQTPVEQPVNQNTEVITATPNVTSDVNKTTVIAPSPTGNTSPVKDDLFD